jgi:hypothetical protein
LSIPPPIDNHAILGRIGGELLGVAGSDHEAAASLADGL